MDRTPWGHRTPPSLADDLPAREPPWSELGPSRSRSNPDDGGAAAGAARAAAAAAGDGDDAVAGAVARGRATWARTRLDRGRWRTGTPSCRNTPPRPF